MVDHKRRKSLAIHLRHLSTGQITNDEFEERVMDDVTYGWLPDQFYRAKESKDDDLAIRPILEYTWCLYDDTFNHRLTAKYELSPFHVQEIARLILFLNSDQEYEWDYVDMTNLVFSFSFKDMLKSIITLGAHYKDLELSREEEIKDMMKQGDFEYWPFIRESDLARQLRFQPFLLGDKN